MTTEGSQSEEPSPAAAALVVSIRGRIVEYKELLLRQLMDQRVALLAIEDVSPDKPKRILDAEAVATTAVSMATAEEAVKREEEVEKVEEVEEVEEEEEERPELKHQLQEEEKRPQDEEEEIASTEDVDMEDATASASSSIANGYAETTADANERKRRASGPIQDETIKPAKTEPQELPVVIPVVRVAKRMRSASTTSDQPQRTSRSSTPPRRYLEHRDDVPEEVRRLDETTHLVLRSPKHPLTRSTSTNASVPTGRARAATSVEDLHADFEMKLRMTMSLQRDVTRRSTAMTRKRQLPRVPTPSRTKSHWDYLLDEMRWMAMDFSHERNWKRVLQHHLAKEVLVAQNAERVRREKDQRQLARGIALHVAAFWRTIERIAARSHVRFEGGVGGTGTGTGSGGGGGGETAGEAESRVGIEDGTAQSDNGERASEMAEEITLRFKTIEVVSALEADAVEATKRHVQQVFGASLKARSVLQLSSDEAAAQHGTREKVMQRLLDDRAAMVSASSSTPTTIFTTFQIVALRWMLELCLANCNILLNDQVGMGKASTVSAFLRTMDYLNDSDTTTARDVSRPHLIVVPPDEVHKWCYYLREWNRDSGIVQVYMGSTPQRALLRAEWRKKLNVPPFFSADEVAELEKEDQTPIFACVCSAADFQADKEAFVSFDKWRTVVVETNHRGLFDDAAFVRSLCTLRQNGRRVLCCSQPLDAWSSHTLRAAYGEFLVHDERKDGEWISDVWSKKTVVDKSSAADVIAWFGKTGSTLLKAQQDHLSALVVALHSLSLRRVRSDCETELGKVEETSIACTLTNAQRVQYRNAVAGFVASCTSPTEDRLALWLQLFLKLRSVCNCVDVLNDPEKLALADLPFLFSSSAKLQNVHELLSRIVRKERRRVVVYCQLDALFPVVEMLLAIMEITFVHVTGSIEMQQRALCHFALRPVVQVAMVSTRLSTMDGKQSMPVYGADAIVVLDSDWNATCDAKLRASWAKCTVGKALDLPVYRFHCDDTIEAALLRGGSCFSEKVFSEMSPQELVADAAGGELKMDKPAWWSPNGMYSASPPTKLNEAMGEVEANEKYCGTDVDASTVMRVVNVELDADEHLLLANSDELTPVEWYAVNYLYSTSTTDKKRADSSDHGPGDDEWASTSAWTTAVSPVSARLTFEQAATAESRRMWQELDAEHDLFYPADEVDISKMDDTNIETLLRPLRTRGLDPHYDVKQPPDVPTTTTVTTTIDSEPIVADAMHHMMFRVSYREPAPPAPPPSLILKLKADTSMLQGSGVDASGKAVRKKRKDLSGRGGASGTSATAGAGAGGGPGVKRKHDPHFSNGAGNHKLPKEPRLDFDGIPLPSDMAEFADDDFWGDTNLDALDAATWDDSAVLSGILGPTLDSSPAKGASSSFGATTGTGTTKKKVKSGAGRSGHDAAGGGGTGRARKGSISDSGKDGWQVHDDIVLKKLFELYGSNWTLIAHVFNTATSVSRFVFRKRTPRQCYDRYGKIISSGSLSGSSTAGGGSSGTATPPGGTPTKEGTKASGAALLKQHKLNAAAAAVWTPQVLAERIGIPSNETLLVFAARDSLPGVPPPSIVNVPSLAELTLKKKRKTQKQQSDVAASASTLSGVTATTSAPGGLDDLKSIRTSFDAIIQCMKRKTPPPPIPIPQPSSVTTDSLAAAASGVSGAPGASPTKVPHSIVTPVPLVVPPPHKSHVDLVEMLPHVPLGPDDVIKRSKEAAAVAVQAAAAVASAGRAGATPEVSPLANAVGESLMGTGFNSATVAARKASQANASSIAATRPSGVGNSVSTSKLGVAGAAAWGDPASAMRPAPTTTAPPGAVGHVGMGSQSTAMGAVGPPTTTATMTTKSARNTSPAVPPPTATTAMPVTTSALLHVLDRMPEIKNKIQAILNRTDCSEAQKVAMIARLLSNTNAINATAVAAAATGNLSAAVSATIAAANASANVSAPSMVTNQSQSLDTPIPMPASLANDSNALSSSAVTGSIPTAIPMPASIAASVTTATSAAAAAASSAALASALADTDMADLA